MPNYPFSWIPSTLRLSESFMLNHTGLDTVMHLRLLRSGFFIMLLACLLVAAPSLPVNSARYRDENAERKSGLELFSISNIPKGSSILYLHMTLMYVLSAIVMLRLWRDSVRFVELHRDLGVRQVRDGGKATRSIMVTNLPKHLRDEGALRDHFESLGIGEVEQATVLRYPGKLERVMTRREKALTTLEKVHVELAKNVAVHVKKRQATLFIAATDRSQATGLRDINERQKLIRRTTGLTGAIRSLITSVKNVTLRVFTGHTPDDAGTQPEFVRNSTSLFELQQHIVMGHTLTTQQQRDLSVSSFVQGDARPDSQQANAPPPPTADNPLSAHNHSHVLPGSDSADEAERLQKASFWTTLLSLPRGSLDRYHPRHNTLKPAHHSSERLDRMLEQGQNAPKVLRSAIDHYYKKFQRLDEKAQEFRAVDPATIAKATTTGFVTFRHPASAQLCAQSVVSRGHGDYIIQMAPEPRDIMWPAHAVSAENRATRKTIITSAIWALTIFWLFPMSGILYLASYEVISKNIPALAPVLTEGSFLSTLLKDILPAALSALFLSIMPFIMYEISKYEYTFSFSALENNVLTRYYRFAFFNVIVVFLVGSTFLKYFVDLIQRPTSVFDSLAQYIPSGASFFVNYVILSTSIHGLELIQLWVPLIASYITSSRAISSLPRDLQKHTAPWSFPYFYYYPLHILILVVCITYAVLSPMIVFFGTVYFGFGYLVFKHQFAYAYVRQYEGGGKAWRYAYGYICDGLVFAQLTLIGMLSLKDMYPAAACLVPLPFLTVLFRVYTRSKFRRRMRFIPLESLRDATMMIVQPVGGDEAHIGVAKEGVPMSLLSSNGVLNDRVSVPGSDVRVPATLRRKLSRKPREALEMASLGSLEMGEDSDSVAHHSTSPSSEDDFTSSSEHELEHPSSSSAHLNAEKKSKDKVMYGGPGVAEELGSDEDKFEHSAELDIKTVGIITGETSVTLHAAEPNPLIAKMAQKPVAYQHVEPAVTALGITTPSSNVGPSAPLSTTVITMKPRLKKSSSAILKPKRSGSPLVAHRVTHHHRIGSDSVVNSHIQVNTAGLKRNVSSASTHGALHRRAVNKVNGADSPTTPSPSPVSPRGHARNLQSITNFPPLPNTTPPATLTSTQAASHAAALRAERVAKLARDMVVPPARERLDEETHRRMPSSPLREMQSFAMNRLRHLRNRAESAPASFLPHASYTNEVTASPTGSSNEAHQGNDSQDMDSDTSSHLEPDYPTVPARIRYQDLVSDPDCYLHPALVKPLSRRLWLPADPLTGYADLDDTVELDRAIVTFHCRGRGILGAKVKPEDWRMRRKLSQARRTRERRDRRMRRAMTTAGPFPAGQGVFPSGYSLTESRTAGSFGTSAAFSSGAPSSDEDAEDEEEEEAEEK